MKEVKIGIIGMGSMGHNHARNIQNGKVSRARLVAVCDADESALDSFDDSYAKFTDSRKLLRSGLVDAVLIVTPHYSHTTIGIDALQQGVHTLVEKPISVHKAAAERLVAAHDNPDVVFSAMFNQRTSPLYQKLRELIQTGELGEISRVNWIVTNWFRTQSYYDRGGWRATWAGEGGGVLLNQCPHNLDLMQWLFGMPVRVRAFCGLGKRHNIEVEDEVTAYLEYDNGATGVFITSTGETPGTNRLEVSAERGKVVIEDGQLSWWRNTIGQTDFIKNTPTPFGRPEIWKVEIPSAMGPASHHVGIIQDFVDAILDGKPLLAPASEGIASVELGNAMLYSSLTGKTVEMPLDGAAYERMLRKLIRESKVGKKEPSKSGGKTGKGRKVEDLSGTF